MERVFAHDNILLVYNLKNLLEHAGITCELRNELSSAAAGEVPPIAVWPEIRVRLEDLGQAQEIIEQVLGQSGSQTSWMCPKCSESNAPAFDFCWQCSEARPQ